MWRGRAGTLSRAEQQPRGTKPPNPSDVSHAGARGQNHPHQDTDSEEPGRALSPDTHPLLQLLAKEWGLGSLPTFHLRQNSVSLGSEI